MKTADLTGAALDWAVAKCEGFNPKQYLVNNASPFHPSTDWAQGGPIIERAGIGFLPAGVHRGDQCEAFIYHRTQHDLSLEDGMSYRAFGPTPLIAAMRCYVTSLGDEVEVPEEL